MSNQLHHNKWHAFNHFTVPLEGFPDSGTDPIASREYPFLGVFYSSISGFARDIGRSDSAHWWWYSSNTQTHSGWWELYPSVLSTTQITSAFWDSGYSGYTTLRKNSAYYDSYYSSTYSISGADEYDLAGGVNGPGGIGWHIALSATCHRLNDAQVNIRQKVARPVRLLENNDKTVVWDLSAQTVYVSLTGNYIVTASEVKNLKKGGKYTMWVYIDRCPEQNMKMFFNSDYYSIIVKTLSGDRYFSTNTNVVRLSSSSITRIDFTCDGKKMLGKASQYSIWVPTTKDLYFRGLGLRMTDPTTGRNKSPVYVTHSLPSPEPSEYIKPADDSINIEFYSNVFTATSSLYVDGPPASGIKMRFLNANTQYMNCIVYNASWPSSLQLALFPSLTSSFDRIVNTLSSFGDFKERRYAQNLICSPGSETIVDDIITRAYPEPPYELVTANIREVIVCTSAYELQIYSGKDRDIDRVLINNNEIEIIPVKINGVSTPYTFLNERTCSVPFVRIQDDNTVEAFFKPQMPLTIPNNILWFNMFDDTLINSDNGPVIDFYLSWNMGTTVVTSYNPGEPVIQNEFDRPRINSFRSDGTYLKYISAGFEVLCGRSIFYPWDNRLSGYDVISIPAPGGLRCGIDLFTATHLTTPNLSPSIGNWSVTTSNPGELKYEFDVTGNVTTDVRDPIYPIGIGLDGRTPPEWPVASYPTIKTWESTAAATASKPLTSFFSNTNDNKKLFQYNIANAPNIFASDNLRGVELSNGKFMTLNTQLAILSSEVFFKPFTTFTVISTTNTFNSSSIIWWLGEFYGPPNTAKGYGLFLKNQFLYNTTALTRPVATLSANRLYIISTSFGGSGPSNRVLVDNVSTYNRRLVSLSPVSSFNFIIGKNPESNNMYCNGIRLLDFYMYNKSFNNRELLEMNFYLRDKFEFYK